MKFKLNLKLCKSFPPAAPGRDGCYDDHDGVHDDVSADDADNADGESVDDNDDGAIAPPRQPPGQCSWWLCSC